MPVHDWTRVSAGTFHHFHTTWITHLCEALNGGVLPDGYYALAEQHAGQIVADVVTLQYGEGVPPARTANGPVAVAEAAPVGRRIAASEIAQYRLARRTVTIRHTSHHRVVALVEIVSSANKDRAATVVEFVDKACATVRQRAHLLLVDLFPSGPHDPERMHGAIAYALGLEETRLPDDKPLTLASYVAGLALEAFVEPLAVGDRLPDMPLFLHPEWYVNVPLEATYQAAYRGVPAFWREIIER